MREVQREYLEQPDLRGLLALYRTGAHGSVSAAATELGWSHPTVDHHINKLERLLGVKLLERTSRGSTPTVAGRFVCGHAEEILARCRQLVIDVQSARYETSSVIRCAMIPTLASATVSQLQHLLKESPRTSERWGAKPQIDLTIDEISSILTHTEQGKIDLALIVGDRQALLSRADRLSFEPVCTETVYLCVSKNHRLAHSHSEALPPLRLFRDDRWAVGTERQDPLDQALLKIGLDAGFSPQIGMKTNDYSVVQQLVGNGLVVAFVPQSGLVKNDQIHRWAVPKETLRREILLVTRNSLASRNASDGTQPSQAQRPQAFTTVSNEIVAITRRFFQDSESGSSLFSHP